MEEDENGGSQPNYDELIYEDRFVAFIDILGWREAVMGNKLNSAMNSKELGWLLGLFRHEEDASKARNKFFSSLPLHALDGQVGLEVTQFSDSVVISIPAKSKKKNRDLLEGVLDMLCSSACQNGFLLRGGVVRGELYHSDRIVYGPALIRAYDLENRKACFPRIILDKDIVSDFYPGRRLFENGEIIGYYKFWRRSNDGYVFFDYMEPTHHIRQYRGQIVKKKVSGIPFFMNYKHLICKGIIKSCNNENVLEKYEWARDYFCRAIKEHPEVKIQPVVVEIGENIFAFNADEWPNKSDYPEFKNNKVQML